MSDDILDIQPFPSGFRGKHGTLQAKKAYLNYLSTGLRPKEAAERVGVSLYVVAGWKRSDPEFERGVEIVMGQLRDMVMPEIERNILNAAMEPGLKGAKFGLEVAERLNPDVWGKKKAGPPAAPPSAKLSDWMGDPEPIDAIFRVKGMGDDDGGTYDAQPKPDAEEPTTSGVWTGRGEESEPGVSRVDHSDAGENEEHSQGESDEEGFGGLFPGTEPDPWP